MEAELRELQGKREGLRNVHCIPELFGYGGASKLPSLFHAVGLSCLFCHYPSLNGAETPFRLKRVEVFPINQLYLNKENNKFYLKSEKKSVETFPNRKLASLSFHSMAVVTAPAMCSLFPQEARPGIC